MFVNQEEMIFGETLHGRLSSADIEGKGILRGRSVLGGVPLPYTSFPLHSWWSARSSRRDPHPQNKGEEGPTVWLYAPCSNLRSGGKSRLFQPFPSPMPITITRCGVAGVLKSPPEDLEDPLLVYK